MANLQWCPAGEGVAGPLICRHIVFGAGDGHGMRDEWIGIFVPYRRTCGNGMFIPCHTQEPKMMFVTFGTAGFL